MTKALERRGAGRPARPEVGDLESGGLVGNRASTIRNGTTVDLRGLASLSVGGKSRFYRLDLLQGRANDRGAFSSRNQVTGIAIPLNQL